MTVKEFFGLSHHKHSGKRLAHKHTSYAGLAIIILCAGLVPALIIQSVVTADPPPISDTIEVSANVNAEAPVIISPVNEQRFSGPAITVSGTCQAGLTVSVFKNNLVAGSTPCQADGTFRLQIDLLLGKNELYARHYQPGPVGPGSKQVIVFYDQAISSASTPANQASSPPEPTNQCSASAKQLIVISEESTKALPFGKELSWRIRLEGGCSPYALNWDWGDGKIDLVSLARSGEFTTKHTYAAAGNYQITINATDSNGQSAKLELVAIATGLNIINRLENNLTSTSEPRELWWAMSSLLLACTAFWVGEHFKMWRRRLHRRGISGRPA